MTSNAPTTSSSAAALRAVVVGGSAGGVEALRAVLGQLPPSFSVPIIAVLHVATGSVTPWASVFSNCSLRVQEGEDKDRIEPGTVTIAPPNYHMLVDREGRVVLSTDAPVMFSRPSIDVLFDSAAWAFGQAALGIVLSGANADGAAGLRAIRAAGGGCWVQDPASAVAAFMPRAALAAVPDAQSLAPAAIGAALAAVDHARRAPMRQAAEMRTDE